MKPLLITRGRIIDPGQRIDEVGNLLVADGKIGWMGREMPSIPEGCDVMSAEGLVVCPGFIDLHCHLREPGYEEKETIATGTRAAARGGFTTVCCMPNTKPAIDSPATVQYIRKKALEVGLVRVLSVGCVTKGRGGGELADMEKLAASGVVGFSDDGDPVRGDEIMIQALTMSRRLALPIIDHCEDPVGGPPEGEVKMVARDLSLAAEVEGWVHIAHVSVAASVELIRQAKRKGVKVTAEVTPHHLTLTEEAVTKCGTVAKVNPPLRTEEDCRALVQALKDGTIDVIATDHAPHTQADKEKPFGAASAGISGFETALGSLMALVRHGDLTLYQLISKLTFEPARLLGQKGAGLGTLAAGSAADVVVFDAESQWTVDTADFASKGKNTPLAATVLKGKVLATVMGGLIVHRDAHLSLKENALVKST